MKMIKIVKFTLTIWPLLLLGLPVLAATKTAPPKKTTLVAYDAKDKRYYSLAYAKAHGMHDRGGDPLVIRPFGSLPKDAKMSRAMHGKM